MIYFTIPELTFSTTAARMHVRNEPGRTEVVHLHYLVDTLLDPLREALGAPIVVQSGYRSAELNRLVGGSRTSQHMEGLAADISSVGQNRALNQRICDLLLSLGLPFDQCIRYDEREDGPRWIHLGIRAPEDVRHPNRREMIYRK